METREFSYLLPEDRVAHFPALRRDHSRLLVLERKTGKMSHCLFYEVVDFLGGNDLLVINDTRVFPARLLGQKDSGGAVELLLLNDGAGKGNGVYRCLIKASRIRAGTGMTFPGGLRAQVVEAAADGSFSVRFEPWGNIESLLDKVGLTPLPPYIKRESPYCFKELDRERYQTVYATSTGAVAAPTAGLHFTPELLCQLEAKGVIITRLTLHVGWGSFKPIKNESVEEHRLASEWYQVPASMAALINEARARRKRVVATGTTAVRALETASTERGEVRAGEGYTDLYIYPGYRFKMVDAMITNFHLPRSSLLVLVCAFAGKELVLQAYAEAVRLGYRFYSYGDAMLIL